jgi:hypothetical protein
MKYIIDTHDRTITVEGVTVKYHPQSPVGTAVRLLEKLLKADKAINYSLITQRVR